MKNKFRYCLVQVLVWEVDKRKNKKLLNCEECPFKNKCKKAVVYAQIEKKD